MSHKCRVKLCQEIYMNHGQPHRLTADAISGSHHIYWNFQNIAAQASKYIHMNMLCVSRHTSIVSYFNIFTKALCSVMHELHKRNTSAHDSRIN